MRYDLLIWVALGVGLSLIHAALITRTVGLATAGGSSQVRSRVTAGYLVRYLSLVIVLSAAVRDSVGAGIVVSLGYAVSRWLSVFLGRLGSGDRSRYSEEQRS